MSPTRFTPTLLPMDPNLKTCSSDDESVEIVDSGKSFSPFKSQLERQFYEEDCLMRKQMKRAIALKHWKWDEVIDLTEDCNLKHNLGVGFVDGEQKLGADAVKLDQDFGPDAVNLEQKLGEATGVKRKLGIDYNGIPSNEWANNGYIAAANSPLHTPVSAKGKGLMAIQRPQKATELPHKPPCQIPVHRLHVLLLAVADMIAH